LSVPMAQEGRVIDGEARELLGRAKYTLDLFPDTDRVSSLKWLTDHKNYLMK